MKKFVLMIGLVLMMGIVAAHYEPDYKEKFSETKIISKTVTLVNYDNDKRFSTYDYRNGYSYRATQDYFHHSVYPELRSDEVDKKYGDDYYYEKYVEETRDVRRHEDRKVRNYDKDKRYSYEYVPYLKSYEKRECYVNPPRDQLFYIKC